MGNFKLEYKDARNVDVPNLILNIDKLERHLESISNVQITIIQD